MPEKISNDKYGILLNDDIKLQRIWFKQMAQLLGIKCKYWAPMHNKNFNQFGELETNYHEPQDVYVVFENHPDQKTLKKRGWVAELQENSSMIHVPYDLPGLEVGALFTLPSGIDDAEGRFFRVIAMQNIMVYPSSIACEIAPEYRTNDELSEIHDFKMSDQNILVDCEDDD